MGYIESIRELIGNMPVILNSAGVILKDTNENILLVHRMDTNNWGLPGGYMELGETFEQTIHRELHEEIGMKIDTLSFSHIYSGKEFYHEYPNGDKVYSVIAIYVSDVYYECNLRVDSSEINEAKFYDLHSLPNNLTTTTAMILDSVKNQK
ncbi:NUDIX hydrolase [Salipaludibacillus sp. CF4.18]|uniref:NUDIX hydrolase n=1 Tax=Salipaludibacillus sp. CF4.18 TaxID=3373081 RepID=UPI003EE799D2